VAAREEDLVAILERRSCRHRVHSICPGAWRLPEELDPRALDARVVLRRFGERQEGLQILLEAGSQRGVQSITFLNMPGIEPLYSGDETMKASLSTRRRLSSSAPFGIPWALSASPSYEGTSKSRIVA
jgi:hypothetical protein